MTKGIKITRNHRAKSIRLKINHDGQPEVTAPKYVPMFVIKQFIESKKDWINKHERPKTAIVNGMLIGRDHKVRVETGQKFSVRTSSSEIIVKLAPGDSIEDPQIQAKVEVQAIECLRKQAKKSFPEIVKMWSDSGVGNYNKVTIKLIRTRWGSYASNGNMSLSLFMAQLPDDLIDYIIVHELSHSKYMNHSKLFWKHVEKFIPNYKDQRKRLRSYNMSVNAK